MTPGPAAPPRRWRFDQRYLAPVLVTCILAVGEYEYRFLESYTATGLAIGTSIAAEVVLGLLATGKVPHLASAYISGISVGMLVRTPLVWPYVVCSLLSITSKYALRVGDRHLWNPSNLGVSVLLLLAPAAVAPLSQQWGNEIWPLVVIWCLGLVILYRLGRLHITLTYVAAFVALSTLRSGLSGMRLVSELALMTQPSFQLFIFFMITDPKTTTRTPGRQCAVAVLVAVVETLLRLQREAHAPYYALFLVAPTTLLLELWWDRRRARATGAAATAAAPAPTASDAPAAAVR